jgi:hypothetical protein
VVRRGGRQKSGCTKVLVGNDGAGGEVEMLREEWVEECVREEKKEDERARL